MTVIATAATAPAPASSSPSPSGTPTLPGYHSVFDDEFEGTKLDRRWMSALPWGNTNPGESQFYTPNNLAVGGGVLTLTARRQNMNGLPYTSGAINSSKSFAFTYGYVEARVQVPAGQGLWPAFWLATTVPTLNDEIDIMEILGSDPTTEYAVVHYGTRADRHKSAVPYVGPDSSAGFHTFAIDWEPNALVWYIDGVERRLVTTNIPSHPMCIVTSLTVGGRTSWSGAPDRYTVFPASLQVDYIRVFQH